VEKECVETREAHVGRGRFQDLSLVQALFYGLKPAVLAVVLEAVLRIGERALKNSVMIAIAAGAFVGIFVYDVPFPAIIVAAATVGYVGGTLREDPFVALTGRERGLLGSADERGESGPAIPDDAPPATPPTVIGAIRTAAVWLSIWWIPVGLLALLLGSAHVFTSIHPV